MNPYQRTWVNDRARFKLWVASRQIGKSFALAFEAAVRAATEGVSQLLVSASQRQSKELMAKVYRHLRALRALSGDELEAARENREECELSNGAVIMSLPASPETIRGFSGDVTLDEFALHRDSRQIWAAVVPSITRGYRLRVASTPLGKQGKFWDLWSKNPEFSKHRTTIYEAVEQGLLVDPEELRAAVDDEEIWQQEYLCQFLDETTAFLPHDLISSCEVDPEVEAPQGEGLLYGGMDIGRRKDLTVIWTVEVLGDVRWTREVLVLKNEPFRVQREALFERLPQMTRCCTDETGLGMQLAEEAVEAFGSYRVEPVTFTAKVKERLAHQLKSLFEDRLVRIPIDRDIHNDLHSLKRTVTAGGNVRFDVDSAESRGHGDYFWALALALDAASTPPAHIAYESVQRRRWGLRRGAW